MIGAIIGDISGSRFKSADKRPNNFDLFDRSCRPTNASNVSLAVAKAILESEPDHDLLSKNTIRFMKEIGRVHRNASYSDIFKSLIGPYNSRLNNSSGYGVITAVGLCGIVAQSVENARYLSAEITKASHNSLEPDRSAVAIAVAVYMARNGRSKDSIRRYIEDNYPDFNFTMDQIRKNIDLVSLARMQFLLLLNHSLSQQALRMR